jgi:hypothetical protein
MPCVYT